MEDLPVYISILFGLTTFLAVGLFYNATNRSKPTIILLLVWLAVQAFVARSGFYTVTDTMPPRFLLLIFIPLLFIIGLFATSKGRSFLDQLDLKALTILHVVRIPVEIVLLLLFLNKVIPELMTFEGRNFDILSGLTAPVIYYFGYIQKRLDPKVILLWHLICLGLLINIVVNAVLSVPFPFQKFAFDQPNIAVLYFPFIWLPCCVVPLVFLSHLAAIRQIRREGRKQTDNGWQAA